MKTKKTQIIGQVVDSEKKMIAIEAAYILLGEIIAQYNVDNVKAMWSLIQEFS